MIRVLIADDHKVLRDGLKAILAQRETVEIVGEAATGREAVIKARKLAPDIAIMDIALPNLNGIEAARKLQAQSSRVKVIILSMYGSREYVLEALRAGAMGYLKKGNAARELLPAIDTVSHGEIYLDGPHSQYVIDAFRQSNGNNHQNVIGRLTTREREVLQMIGEGKSSKSIALLLSLSLKTVETHRQNIMKKLNLHNVAGLVKMAIRAGLVNVE
jgi:DNA-binding NarL/FixJ family response regulator